MNKIQTIIGAALIAASGCALAQDNSMEEVVVTAEFRPTAELATPQSISIIGSEVIKARAAQHFEDVIDAVPNMNFDSGTARARFFQIRGIGEREQFIDPVNPSVGLIIDNVDFSGAGTVATLLDVDQVEILRGPQGTRYGANALAGLIDIKTRDPEDAFSASIGGTAGNYGTTSLHGVVTGPVARSVDYRLAAQAYRSDGYTYNAYLDRHDVNKRAESTVRGKLKFTGDGFISTLTASTIDVNDGYDAFSLDNSGVTLSDQPGHDSQKSTYLVDDSTWQFAPFDAQVIASAAHSNMEYGYDEDWTYVGFDPDGYSSTDYYYRTRNTESLEARLISNDAGKVWNGTTTWVSGLYVLRSSEDLHRVYTYLSSDYFSGNDFITTAAFVQLDSALSEATSVSGGLRVENRRTSFSDSNAVSFSPTETLWGGQLTLKHLLDNGAMTYVRLARGYKAGGFNTDGTLPPDLRQFDSEYLWELETGAKATALEDRLQVRAALFYDLRRDQQVKSSLVRLRPDGSSEFIEFFGNAAKGKNVGVELESSLALVPGLTLFANIGLLHARFDEYTNESGTDLSGRDQSQAPHYTYNVGFDYVTGSWSGRISVDGKDRFYFSDSDSVKGNAYALVNAHVAYDIGNVTVSLWGRNLANKTYYTRAFGDFGNDPRNGYAVEPYYQFGEPRVFGASFDYHL